jgi:UDP-2-acetamido-3-amino-2,3-dideoxy-glucuronate N-acetyltransferase
VGNDVQIGNNVKVQNNVSVYDQVVLEDDVFCGPSMVFTNVVNPRSAVPRRDEFKKTIVRKGATLGANCTVVCGNEIGPFAFVAAGAVITKNVPAYALMAGVPAKQIGWMCECGVRLPAAGAPSASAEALITCTACKSEYVIKDQTCRKV